MSLGRCTGLKAEVGDLTFASKALCYERPRPLALAHFSMARQCMEGYGIHYSGIHYDDYDLLWISNDIYGYVNPLLVSLNMCTHSNMLHMESGRWSAQIGPGNASNGRVRFGGHWAKQANKFGALSFLLSAEQQPNHVIFRRLMCWEPEVVQVPIANRGKAS